MHMLEAEADDAEDDEADKLYFPAGQTVHAVAPAPELNPAKQGDQLKYCEEKPSLE